MKSIGLTAFIVLLASSPTNAQTPATAAPAAIVSQMPCPFAGFENESPFIKRYYSKDEYEQARRSTTVDCSRIQYRSDGLKVVGFIIKPRNVAKRLPVIIYNRGGLLDIGKIDASNILDFYGLAAKGFVVLASQYRGNDGGEGHEELGGADVDDVVNLLALARELPYADGKNIFFYGLSRGGMMTFLALRGGGVANAAAVVGAVYDLPGALEAVKRQSPGIADTVAKIIPNYGSTALAERSAMNWPEQVKVPLLMIHGGQDDEVPLTQALAFASKLNELHNQYELVVYGDDIHEASGHRAERDAKIVAWFRQFMK